MNAFLRSARRRLRVVWAFATAQWMGPVVAATALALVLAGRARPWTWPEPVAFVAVALVAVGVLAVAGLRPLPPLVVARAVDRGLMSGDVFATALELDRGRATSPFAGQVRARAEALASGRTAKDAVPLPLDRQRVGATLLLLAVAFALAVAHSAQDDVRAQLRREQAVAATEAERLREAADEARQPGEAAAEPAVAALERAAAELADAKTLDAALSAIEREAAELAAEVDPDFLAAKAATVGLERSLETAPLLGRPGTAADQLAAAGDALSSLSAEELSELATRLEALAATQLGASREAGDALLDAAAALHSGDLTLAAAALDQAAAAHGDATERVTADEARLAAVGQLALSAQRLRDGAAAAGASGANGDGSGSGTGSGSGQGDGNGDGAGSGSGTGSGSGQGSGQGSNGSPSGEVTGAAGGSGSGQGGQGTAGGSGRSAGTGGSVDEASVVAPIARGEDGEEVVVPGQIGAGPSEVTGRHQGLTTRGTARVSARNAIPLYRSQAVRALDRLNLSPSTRALVRAYFDTLAAEQ